MVQVLHAQSGQREDITLTQPWIKRVTSVFSLRDVGMFNPQVAIEPS